MDSNPRKFNLHKIKHIIVTGFGKMCIVHTSNFSTLVTDNISLEGQIGVKLSGIVEPIFL